MFYFKIIETYVYSIQLHYDLKLNFSDRMKHLSFFLNEGKGHIHTNIVTYIVLHMYRDKFKVFIYVGMSG